MLVQFEMGILSLNFPKEKEVSFSLLTRRILDNHLGFYVK